MDRLGLIARLRISWAARRLTPRVRHYIRRWCRTGEMDESPLLSKDDFRELMVFFDEIGDFPNPRPRLILARKGARAARLLLLVIPKKRRHEVIGDFYESIDAAKRLGYRRLALWVLCVLKLALYSWGTVKLRLADFAHPSVADEDEQVDTPD